VTRRIGGSAALAFGLLAGVCVFVAMAGPRDSLNIRTHALRQTIAAAQPAGDSVVASAALSSYVGLGPYASASPVTSGQLSRVTAQLASRLSAAPLPLAARTSDWSSLTTGYSRVLDAAPSANAGSPPYLELAYDSALGRHSRLIAGREPGASSVTGPRILGQAPSAATFGVAVTEATAARFSLRPGSRLAMAGNVTLVVTGVVRPVSPRSAFWTLDPDAAAPALAYPPAGPGPPHWTAAAFVGPGEVANLQYALGGTQTQLRWDFPLALGSVDAAGAQALSDNLNRGIDTAAAHERTPDGLPGTITLSSGLAGALGSFLALAAAVQAVLSLLVTGLTVIGAVVLLLGGRMLAERRARDDALMRARGAALWQLSALALQDGAIVAAPAAVAGAAAALAATPGPSAPLAWWLAGTTALIALGSPALAAALRHRSGGGASGRASRRPDARAGRSAAARRWVAEATITAAAAGGLTVLRQQGLGGGFYPSAAPVLVAAPVALLILRVYPVALRGLLRLTAQRAGANGFVGLATAARASATTALPTFALVLALAVAALGGMIRGAVLRGEVAASWQTTGADAVIDASATPGGLTPAAEHAIGAVPGAEHTAAALITNATLSGSLQLAAVVVNPAQYGALTAATPLPRFRAAALARPRGPGPVPVLASPAAAAAIGRSGTQVLMAAGILTIRVAGQVSSTAALPGRSAFIVLPLWALDGVRYPPRPDHLLVVGPGLDEPTLAAVVGRMLPKASVTSRAAALAALTSAPLQRSAYAAFAAGIAVSAGFSAVVLLLGLALGARPRDMTLARLATMGLGRGQGRLLVAAEVLPSILAAAAGGAVCAWALAPLIGPALDLSAFTGSATRLPVQADPGTLAWSAAGLVAVGAVALSAQIARARARGVASSLRIDG
jgi:putative ABC transport system permease protein